MENKIMSLYKWQEFSRIRTPLCLHGHYRGNLETMLTYFFLRGNSKGSS